MSHTIELTPEQQESFLRDGSITLTLPKKRYDWFEPERNEYYYYLIDNGASFTRNINHSVDKAILQCQQVFRTKKEAEHANQVRVAVTKVNKFITEQNDGWTPDWNDRTTYKHYTYYDNADDKFYSGSVTYVQHAQTINYCKSIRIVEQIIEQFEPELKLIFGIK